MKPIYGMALLAALAAAPSALEAQTQRGTHGQEQGVRGPHGAPVAMLLQHRAELGLSAEQVNRLEAIGQRLEQQNAPLVAQLRASGAWQDREQMRERMQSMTPEQRQQMRERMRNMTPEQRDAMRQQMRESGEARPRGEGQARGEGMRGQRQIPEALRPVMQQLSANHRAAMQEARAVLTDDQQVRLRELVQQRRGGERTRTPRGTRGGTSAR